MYGTDDLLAVAKFGLSTFNFDSHRDLPSTSPMKALTLMRFHFKSLSSRLSLQIHGKNVLLHETGSYIWARSDSKVLIVNVNFQFQSKLAAAEKRFRGIL